MADYVDGLTDAELRTKLAEYGFPVVPITTTTRKVMTKKLKMLIENKNKIASDGRRSLAKYSSEEESDDDVKTKRDKRRITVAAGMLPPATNKATRKSTRRSVDKQNDIEAVSSVTADTKTRRTTLVKPIPEADLETGSDSEPEIVEEYINNDTPSESTYSRPYLSARSPLGGAVGGSSSPLKPVSTTTSYSSTSRYSSTVLDSSVSPVGPGGDSSADRLNQIRSRLSLGSYDRKVDEPTTSDAPFLSNFSKRLSQLSSSTAPKTDFSYKNDIIKEHDANGSSAFNRGYLSRVRNRDYPLDFKSRQEKNIFKNNFVSFTLLGIAVAFFIGIAFLYVGIRSDNSSGVDRNDPWK